MVWIASYAHECDDRHDNRALYAVHDAEIEETVIGWYFDAHGDHHNRDHPDGGRDPECSADRLCAMRVGRQEQKDDIEQPKRRCPE